MIPPRISLRSAGMVLVLTASSGEGRTSPPASAGLVALATAGHGAPRGADRGVTAGNPAGITWSDALQKTRPLLAVILVMLVGLLAWVARLHARVLMKTRALLAELRERRKAELALKASEERYRLLTEHSHDFISEISPEGRYLYVNVNFQHLLGYNTNDIIGKTPLEAGMIHPEDRPRLIKTFNRTFSRKSRAMIEFRGRNTQGVYRWYECATSCFQAPSGDWKIVAISRDITDQKMKDEAVRQSQKLESLGVLAGGIAHDFSNLLTAMLGNLGLAAAQLPRFSPAEPYLDSVQKTVLRASELCKQLLAYSGKGRFIVRPHDLNVAVREMAELLHVGLNKKIRLEFKLAEGLPLIEADSAQIQQVIMNLITNAGDAIGDREGTIHVRTRFEDLDRCFTETLFHGQSLEPGPYIVLEVTDTGCGMSQDVLGRIFDPFFTTKVAGRGLGLSAMLGILRGHHAGILIQSEVGLGSSFDLYFPALGEKSAPREHPSGELPVVFSGTVLVVDDETLIRESVASTLETLGFETVIASDGEEALEIFSLDPARYRLVFMDLTMPRMDGREAFQAMRALRADIPIVLTSGYSEQDVFHDLDRREMAGFLQKPYLAKDLKKAIAHCLATTEETTLA